MDAIKLEVIYNATNQIAYELTQKLMRNGYSSIVKESQDLALSICDRQGRNVGQYSPNPVGLGVVGVPAQGNPPGLRHRRGRHLHPEPSLPLLPEPPQRRHADLSGVP